jgi:hypothetical protein
MDATGSDTLNTGTISAVTTYNLVSVLAGTCTYSVSGSATVSIYPQATVNALDNVVICNGASTSDVALSGPVVGTAFTWANNNTSIGLAASGSGNIPSFTAQNNGNTSLTATVTVTPAANGCVGTKSTYTITVNPTPAKPVIKIHPSAELCSNTLFQNFGASVPAPNSVDYKWTAADATIVAQGLGRQNSIVSFNNATTAKVILTANISLFSCYKSDTFDVKVSNGDSHTPEFVYYVNGNLVCGDNNVDSYQWGYDDVVTLDSALFPSQINQHFNVGTLDVANKYYWVITQKDGCSQKTYYNPVVGVPNVTIAGANIYIYPNPSTGVVKMNITGVSFRNTIYEITDMAGKKLTSGSVVQSISSIDVTDLATGVHMISVFDGGIKVGAIKLVRN